WNRFVKLNRTISFYTYLCLKYRIPPKELYSTIREKFEELFKLKGFKEVYLEETHTGKFSNKLKEKIPDYRHIVFVFLNEIAPDITGFVEKEYQGFTSTEFVVIEVKNEKIKLDHIYQVKKYAELLNATYAFLVSTEEIPVEIKRLCKEIYSILSIPRYNKIILVYYNKEQNSLEDWYPENPFK
ncbi:MAG: hypothetical protein DRJ52_10290, partial [Thermoprotei archaeon]